MSYYNSLPHILEAIKIAKEKGLNIPILYNTSGYENIETLKMLEGYIDIYLPDFKYYDNDLACSIYYFHNYSSLKFGYIFFFFIF